MGATIPTEDFALGGGNLGVLFCIALLAFSTGGMLALGFVEDDGGYALEFGADAQHAFDAAVALFVFEEAEETDDELH